MFNIVNFITMISTCTCTGIITYMSFPVTENNSLKIAFTSLCSDTMACSNSKI